MISNTIWNPIIITLKANNPRTPVNPIFSVPDLPNGIKGMVLLTAQVTQLYAKNVLGLALCSTFVRKNMIQLFMWWKKGFG